MYMKKSKGRGYVFQDRYKSFLIQNDSYLLAVMAYLLTNPVRAKLVKDFLDYPWSSANLYFNQKSPDWIDTNYIEEMYGSHSDFCQQVNLSIERELPIVNTTVGRIIGDKEFSEKANESKRIDDFDFDPVEKVFQEFKNIHKVDVNKLDTSTHEGKRLRGKLLVYLKDKAGLKYTEIITIPIFSEVKLHSLGKLYKDARIRMKKGK